MTGAMKTEAADQGLHDYVTLGVSSSGDIFREWFFGGTADKHAPDRGKAVAVWGTQPAFGVYREDLFVTGQSSDGNSQNIVTLRYQSR